MRRKLLFLISILCINISYSQKYKDMMYDLNVNFYDVVKEADNYFKTIDITKKGSGWKPFQRWENNNKYKYYPTGRRDNIDPYSSIKAYQSFLKNNNITPQKASFNNGWEELGPSEITNITIHSSPGLGRVEDFYVDPNNPNRIYLGSRSGGFWRTIDEGATWEVTTDFLPASGVNAIAVEESNPLNILINMQESKSEHSYGIYRSNNGGTTWIETIFNLENLNVFSLRINQIKYHPRVPNLVFIGTDRGVYRSTDNLTSMDNLTLVETLSSGSNYENITDIEFHPSDNNFIYVYNINFNSGSRNTIFYSTDAGLSYTQSSQIVGNENARGHISVSQNDSNCIDCVYFASKNGVWKSGNKGVNFVLLSTPPPFAFDGFAVGDLDSTKMIYGGVGTFYSEDEGINFNASGYHSLSYSNGNQESNQTSFETSTDYVHADLRVVKSINGVWYIGTDGFLCKSTDAINWTKLNQGTAIRENYKVGVSQSNHYKSILGSQDNGTSIRTKNGWIEFYGADGMQGIVHPLNDNWMIGSTQGVRSMSVTKDNGQSRFSSPIPNFGAYWESPIKFDPNNHNTIYSFKKAIYRSDDFATSWNELGSPNFDFVVEAAIAENDSNIMIVSNAGLLEKSIDGGLTFVNSGNLPSYITDIAFDPNDDNTIIVVCGSGDDRVYLTTNGGISWSSISNNLGNMSLHSVVIDHTAESNIYIGAEIGVFTKPMNGSQWTLYNPNLPNTTIKDLEIVYGSNTLRAATWGRGLWEYSLVGRNEFPSILTTQITDQPTEVLPKESIDQYVTSTIDYDGTLTDVHVAWSIDNPTFENSIPMNFTTNNTWVSNTPIPNFPEGTTIYFKVFATGNNNDTSETYKFMYTIKSFVYCDASGTGASGGISNVTFNTINNSSNDSEYSDFTAISTDIQAGSTVDLSVTYYSGSQHLNQVSVWIDFNQDKDFLDEGEEFIFPLINMPSPYTQAIPIIVSPNATIGQTRMRIVLSSNTPNACGDGNSEVEDYTLNIVPLCFENTTTWNGSSWNNGVPDNTKYTIIDGDYNNGSFSCCNLRVNLTATITINAGEYISIENNIINNGVIDILHEGSLVQVQDDSFTTGTGEFNVHKTTTPYVEYDYTYWSSPIKQETIGSVFNANPSNNIYRFETSNFMDVNGDTFDDDGNDWQQMLENYVLNPGIGYIAMGETASDYPRQQNINFSETGINGSFNNGVITVPVFLDLYHTSGGTGFDNFNSNFNLIGNPYPSAINIHELYLQNSSVLQGTFYFWTHDTPVSGDAPGPGTYNFTNDDYAIATTDGLVLSAIQASPNGTNVSEFIASTQGFFADVTQNGNITFNNSMRVTGPNDNFKMAENIDRVWLNLTNDVGVFRQILVGFYDTATDNYQDGQDGKRLENGSNTDFYSKIEGDERRFAIQNLAPFNTQKNVKLGIEIVENGQYNISIDQFEGFVNDNQNIYLYDYQDNILHDLMQGDYSFSSNVGTFEDRFELRFVKVSLENSLYFIAKQHQFVRVKYPKFTKISNSDFTIESVINIKKSIKNNIILHYYNEYKSKGFISYINTNGKFVFVLNKETFTVNDFNFALNKCYQVSVVRESNKIIIFINGELVFIDSCSLSEEIIEDSTPFYIGGRRNEKNFYGEIDEVRLFSKALDRETINNNLFKKLNLFEEYVLANYSFNTEGTQVVTDSSLYQNHGSLGNDSQEEIYDPSRINANCIIKSSKIKNDRSNILENDFISSLILSPNPTNGNFRIDLGYVNEKVDVSILNFLGQIVTKKEFISSKILDLNIKGPNGIYFVKISSNKGKVAIIKVIKK